MVRLAIAGTGFISSTHAVSAQHLPEVRLEAVYSRTEERARRFAEQYSIPKQTTNYQALLDDPEVDALVLGLPTPLHREFTIQAAAAGKHVLCEKPIALTLSDADTMIAACSQAGVVLMIAHVLRFWPEYVVARSLVDSAEMGSVRAISAVRLNPAPRWTADDWLLDPERSGGVPVDLHIHDLDFIAWFLGAPERLTARGVQEPTGLVSEVISVLEYPQDRIAYTEAGYILPKGDGLRMGFRIVCEKGVIEYSNQAEPTLRAWKSGKPMPLPELPDEDGYTSQLRYFTDCIHRGTAPDRVPAAAARLALELALKAKSEVEKSQIA